jgi:hypothetical protein
MEFSMTTFLAILMVISALAFSIQLFHSIRSRPYLLSLGMGMIIVTMLLSSVAILLDFPQVFFLWLFLLVELGFGLVAAHFFVKYRQNQSTDDLIGIVLGVSTMIILLGLLWAFLVNNMVLLGCLVIATPIMEFVGLVTMGIVSKRNQKQ